MSLPDFDALGNLPEAIYPCNKATLYDHFVLPFPKSIERIKIYEGFCRLHSKLESLGINATQWIDGSFTTRKLNPVAPFDELEPGDIDVFTVIDYDAANRIPAAWQPVVKGLIGGGETTKASFYTHTMFAASCSPSHPYFPVYESLRRNYRDVFSRHSPPSTRRPNELTIPYPSDGPRKGIIEIVVGDHAQAPHVDGTRY